MDCDICNELYNVLGRRPKVMPCGHSACLSCIQRLQDARCPICRKGFRDTAMQLPDNYLAIRQLEAMPAKPRKQWCLDCGSTSSVACDKERHMVVSMESKMRQLTQRLQGTMSKVSGVVAQELQKFILGSGCSEQQLDAVGLILGGGSCSLTLDPKEQSGGDADAFRATWQLEAAEGGSETQEDFVINLLTAILSVLLVSRDKFTRVITPAASEAVNQGLAVETIDCRDLLKQFPLTLEVLQQWEASLQRIREQGGVRRLLNVVKDSDSPVVRRNNKELGGQVLRVLLLQCAAPLAEEVSVSEAQAVHLLHLAAMPRLRRLDIAGHATWWRAHREPVGVPPLPDNHCGLEWLRVSHLPQTTTLSLVRAHAATLQVLILHVGTPSDGEGSSQATRVWPQACSDLVTSVSACGLRVLRRLVLHRSAGCLHTVARCNSQVVGLRAALPAGVTVECSTCHKVAVVPF